MITAMKKQLALLFTGLALAGFTAQPAVAADMYGSLNGGISWMDDMDNAPNAGDDLEMNGGYMVLGAIGCDYGNYRVEAEAGYQESDVDSYNAVASGGDVKIFSLLANGYYDIDAGGFEPYLTAGVGVANVNFNNVAVTDPNETTLAYQIGAGLAIPVADGVMLDARYRYFSTLEFLDNTQAGSHSALLGFRVGF